MLFRPLLFAGVAALAVGGSTFAHDYKAGALQIEHPWVRATAPGQTMGAGYLLIKNNGAAGDTLVSVSTDAAAKAEIHEVTEVDKMTKMSAVDGLAIPAGKATELAPGGYHVMFMHIKAPFAEGAKVPATLTFAKAGELKIEFKVEPLTYRADSAGHDDHASHADQSHSGHGDGSNQPDHAGRGSAGHMNMSTHK